MSCLRCGYNKRGNEEDYICDDCQEFQIVLEKMWSEIDMIFERPETFDINTDQILRFLADTAFITQDNPQSRIFYKIASLVIEKAWLMESEITEEDLNRNIKTTRNWRDVFILFEELGIFRVKYEKYQRILVIGDLPRKVAMAWRSGESYENELTNRTILVFSGYILLSILKKTNEISKYDDIISLPYKQRLRTLWNTVMLLWTNSYKGGIEVSEYDMDTFLGKRGVPSSTTSKLKVAMSNMYKDQTGLIKDVRIGDDGGRSYVFSDYVVREMERIREGRDRDRDGRS